MNDKAASSGSKRRTTLRKQLGLRIIQARRRRRWNQEALARRLGVNQKTLREWERGSSAPSLESLAKLSEVLEMTYEELIRGGPAPEQRIPPAQRSEVAMCLNGLLRAMRPLLQPAEEKKRKE
jgi:transcriptional regulator with XRE-family HTH domain